MTHKRMSRVRWYTSRVALLSLAVTIAQGAAAQEQSATPIDSADTPVLLWTPYPVYRVDPTTGTLTPTGDRVIFAPYGAAQEDEPIEAAPSQAAPRMQPATQPALNDAQDDSGALSRGARNQGPGDGATTMTDAAERAALQAGSWTAAHVQTTALRLAGEQQEELDEETIAAEDEVEGAAAREATLTAAQAEAVAQPRQVSRDDESETRTAAASLAAHVAEKARRIEPTPRSRERTLSADATDEDIAGDQALDDEPIEEGEETSPPDAATGSASAENETDAQTIELAAAYVRSGQYAASQSAYAAAEQDAPASDVLLVEPLNDGSGEGVVFATATPPPGTEREAVMDAATSGAAAGTHVAQTAAAQFPDAPRAATQVAIIPADVAQPLSEHVVTDEASAEAQGTTNEADAPPPERPDTAAAVPEDALPLEASAPVEAPGRVVVYEASPAEDTAPEATANEALTDEEANGEVSSETTRLSAAVAGANPEDTSAQTDDSDAQEAATGIVAGAVVVGASAGASSPPEERRRRRPMQGRLVASLDERDAATSESSEAGTDGAVDDSAAAEEAESEDTGDAPPEGETEGETQGETQGDGAVDEAAAAEEAESEDTEDAPLEGETEGETEGEATGAELAERSALHEEPAHTTSIAPAERLTFSLPILMDGTPATPADALNDACEDDADCDDGLFCNGEEYCDAGICAARVPEMTNAEDDGVACTRLRCDEAADVFADQPFDSLCSDGIFCNGVEVCDPDAGGCVAGPTPIPETTLRCASYTCDEESQEVRLTPDAELCPENAPRCGPGGCDLSIDACGDSPPLCLDDRAPSGRDTRVSGDAE